MAHSRKHVLYRCTNGFTVRFGLSLLNPADPAPAANIIVSSTPCITPGCTKGTKVLPSMYTTSTGVLTGTTPCAIGADLCGVCGGGNTLCAGCDGVPLSGAVVDLCGVCGGKDACVGCNGVPFSGLVYDLCGVCGGSDACITSLPLDGHAWGAWPSIDVNLSVTGTLSAENLGTADRKKIKTVLAGIVGIQPQSVDLVSLQDIVVLARRADDNTGGQREDNTYDYSGLGSLDSSRFQKHWATLLKYYASQFVGFSESNGKLREPRHGGYCDATRAAWSGCRIGTGEKIMVLRCVLTCTHACVCSSC